MDVSLIFYSYSLKVNYPLFFIYPVRNNAPLLPPGQRPSLRARGSSEPEAVAGLHFRIIPAGSNATLEFLTGFTLHLF